MSYQSCRWYDPYPRLAFALKLLFLAPVRVQSEASAELRQFLLSNWGMAQPDSAQRGQRGYDQASGTAETVELLKNTPEALKSRAADTLLAILSADLP